MFIIAVFDIVFLMLFLRGHGFDGKASMGRLRCDGFGVMAQTLFQVPGDPLGDHGGVNANANANATA